MKILFKLRKQKKAAVDKANALVQAAEAEDRELTEDEKAVFKECMSEADSLTGRIENLEKLEGQMVSDDGLVVEDDKTINVGQPRILDDPTLGFADLGEFASSIKIIGSGGAVTDERLQIMAASGMTQGTGSEGGFLVPPSFAQTIYDGVMGASESLIGQVDSYTVVGESLTFPAIDETSRANGSRFGGVRGYWLNEGGQMTGSKPKLRQIKVEPQQMAVMIYATDKLLSNAPALGQLLTRAATDEINFMTGDAIINGNGVGKPKGIMSSGGLVTVAKETSQTADTIVAANINKMWARLPFRSWANAVWLVNQDALPQLDGVNIPTTDVGGTATAGGFSTRIYDPEKFTLKGRPIIPLEYCQTIGDKGDIILADLKGYVAGLKGAVKSAMSIHLKFDYNETAFRFIFEVDGQTWLSSAITPKNGSSTLSHFVTLAAR